MSDLPPDDLPDGLSGDEPPDVVLAAEHALALHEGETAARLEARSASDQAFAAEAAAWSTRLHPLVEELAPIEAPATLWPRIARAANLPPERATEAVSADPSATPAPAPPPVASSVTPLPNRALALWRAWALTASVAAAACLALVVVVAQRQAPAGGPLYVARLEPPATSSALDVEPLFTATLDPARRTVVIAPVAPGPVDARARELWLIPADGRPRAVGVIDAKATRPAPLTDELLRLARPGAKLAVSLEPEGGAPHGAPTGPVIAAGVLARI